MEVKKKSSRFIIKKYLKKSCEFSVLGELWIPVVDTVVLYIYTQ